ncbi:hypothetical protein AWB64_02130 [Caballeronia sordidicola]|uniref:Uncharacterized protein n=1 Tax=Caballeronia sordidicola TaxID=196367 RepID=A0A158G1V1_CABSO|nr:hypothetical protein [Caballeronia sordidicola]SAL26066.1 hypothetical protein AWB64_02130 [Caballeronia sordidicola]
MNLKTIIAKVVSWFKGEASTIEHDIALRVDAATALLNAEFTARFSADQALSSRLSTIEEAMSTPATAAAPAAQATPVNQINTAVQIALTLKAIDASLSVDAVQAATNAALGALYPTTA